MAMAHGPFIVSFLVDVQVLVFMPTPITMISVIGPLKKKQKQNKSRNKTRLFLELKYPLEFEQGGLHAEPVV